MIALFGSARARIELGVLEKDPDALQLPGFDRAARYAPVRVVPGDYIVDARIVQIGQGPDRGLFMAPQAGDQCIVLFPGGRENGAVAITGIGSDAAPHPASADGSRAVILHDGGIDLRTSDTGDTQTILLAPLLPDLKDHLTSLSEMIDESLKLAVQIGVFATAVNAILPGSSAPLTAQIATYSAGLVAYKAKNAALQAKLESEGTPGAKYATSTIVASE